MHNVIDRRGFYSEFLDDEPTTLDIEADVNISGSFGFSGSFSINCTKNLIYVDLDGNDITGDGTFTSPYRTIAKAVQIVSASVPTLLSSWGIHVGAGTFIATEITLPPYTGIYGVGTGTTKVQIGASGSKLFNLGTRNRVERMTLTGISTGSSTMGLCSISSDISYIDTPRVFDLVVRDFTTGVHVASGSSMACYDIRAWDNQFGFVSDEGNMFDTYNCQAYQLANPNASGTIGVKITGADRTLNWAYLFAFNT